MARSLIGSLCSMLVVAFLSGCATETDYVLKNDADNIKLIAVVSSLSDPRLVIFDKTGPGPEAFVFVHFDPVSIAAAYAVAGIAKTIDKEIKKSRSLGGDPDDLVREMEGFPIEAVLDNRFAEVFGQKVSIVHPHETKGIELDPPREAEGTIDYSPLKRRFGADTALLMDYRYGLAFYAEQKASAAVSAEVSLVDINDGRVIMRTRILCDTPFLGGHTVDEYKADNARLFKEEIAEAARSLASVMVVYVTMPLSAPPEESIWTPRYY